MRSLGGWQGRTTNPMVQREKASARQPGIGGRCEGGGNLGASAAGEGWGKENDKWSGDSEWNTSILVPVDCRRSHDGTTKCEGYRHRPLGGRGYLGSIKGLSERPGLCSSSLV